jgi:hypothetical protein
MPKISVSVPHAHPLETVIERIQPALKKTVADFQGHDLTIDWHEEQAEFQFKSLGFTIKGDVTADAAEVTVNLELPFAAMMYKEKAKKGIARNITAALAD